MKAEMKYGDDHLKATYFYERADGTENWFFPERKDITSNLLDLLVELKSYFKKNNLFKGDLPWNGVNLTIDVANKKIKCDFLYP